MMKRRFLNVVLMATCIVSLACCAGPGGAAPEGTTTAARPALPSDWGQMVEEWDRLKAKPHKTEEELARAAALLSRLAVLAYQAGKSGVSVKGDVVDEDGQPLKDVTLTVNRVNAPGFKMGPGGLVTTGGGGLKETRVVNDTFDVSTAWWWGIGLEFSKKGFLPCRLGFDGGAMLPSELLLHFSEGVITPSPVVKEGLRVELARRNIVSPTLFQIPSGQMTLKVDGSGNGLAIHDSLGGDMAEKAYDRPEQIKDLPPDTLSVEILRTPDSKAFVMSELKTQRNIVIPAQVTVRMNATNGGIVFAEPHRHDYHFMREAPADGYQQEIVLTAEQILDNELSSNEHNNGAFFYFKTSDGKYGKGDIQGGVRRGSIALLGVRGFIQRNGSRDVQTE